MKKIMKKFLSLALVVALAIAPMTVMAADSGTAELATGLYAFEGTATVAANSTCYYEIGMPDFEEYEFIVTGTTGFSVGSCYETGGIWTIGAGADDTNGTVNTTIKADSESWGSYAGFAIENMTASEQEYTYKIVMPEGSQGNPKSVTLTVGGSAQVTVPANSQYYVALTLPEMYKEFQLTISGNTGFGMPGASYYAPTNWDTDGVIETTVAAYYGPAKTSIINNTTSEQTYTLALANMPIGSSANPDSVTVDTEITKAVDGAAYWYKWTPVVDGTLTITVDEETSATAGWFVNVDSKSIQKSSYWNDAATFSFDVTADEPVLFGVSVLGLDPWGEVSPSGYGSGDVVFTLSFAEKTADDNNNDDNNNDDGTGSGGGSATGTEINENYYYSYQELSTEANEIMAQFGYTTTLYTFIPTEVGEYKVTINDQSALLGYYGSNEWFPFDNTESKTYELTLNATQANAPMLIGVSNALNATITITRVGDIQEEDTIDWTIYENSKVPTAFEFTGDADKLEYVDIEDSTVDEAVLGTDGYYHLNDANGPILYVDLDEIYGTINVIDAMGYGQLKYIVVENGETVAKIDYNTAFGEYVAVADADTMLYPLTEDLMTIYKNVGESQTWYGENGWVGGTKADAWMFACYYEKGASTQGGTTTGGTTSGSTSTTDSPKTGDNANVAVWAIAMVVAAGAAFVVAESKKRAR